MIFTGPCDHGRPPDGSCSACMRRSEAVVLAVVALFEKHSVPEERRWTMLLGQAVGALVGAGVSLDEVLAETQRVYGIVKRMMHGKPDGGLEN